MCFRCTSWWLLLIIASIVYSPFENTCLIEISQLIYNAGQMTGFCAMQRLPREILYRFNICHERFSIISEGPKLNSCFKDVFLSDNLMQRGLNIDMTPRSRVIVNIRLGLVSASTSMYFRCISFIVSDRVGSRTHAASLM